MDKFKECTDPDCLTPGPQPLNNFYSGYSTVDGHMSVCKKCRRSKMRLYYHRKLKQKRGVERAYCEDGEDTKERIEALLKLSR